jgi:putative PEP-CTERM system TPR-repeat lipoprotein
MNIKIIFIIILFTLSACTSKTKDELYAQGIKQLEASNPGGAVILFKSALEQDENYLDARFQLAKCYAKLGKLEQAEKEFNKVLKQNPARDEVLIELAGVLNASKKGDEAFKLGQQYLAIHPGSAEGFEVLGIASAINKRFDDAERYLLQSVAADQTRAKTKLELAALYVTVGKEAKAKDLLNELIRTDPKNARPLFMLAAMETRAGNRDKALEIYHTIMTNHPEEAVAAYKIGIIYIEKGDLDKADKTADDLLSRFPKRADGHRLKGLVSYHRKNYAEAMNYLQSSIKIAPTLEAYHFLGLCYYNRGELESALSQFRIILDHVPDSRQARLMTGTILLAQKRLDDAVTEIQKVLQKDDRDAVAHNLLGNAYMAKGMFEDGMREFNKATKIDPKIVDAYLKKGYFYFSRGKNVEGETELTTAVQAAPDALNSRLLLALSLAQEYDHTVLLIDADFRRPSIHRYLGIEQQKGFSDCLLGEAEIGEVLIPTGIGRLSIITSGREVLNPAELFASQKAEALIADMKNRYQDRFIIFDSPPVLPFAEARTLAHLVDGVLFVVKEQLASQKNVKEAISALKGCGLLGMVYNDVVIDRKDEKYTSYHNYGQPGR